LGVVLGRTQGKIEETVQKGLTSGSAKKKTYGPHLRKGKGGTTGDAIMSLKRRNQATLESV